MGTVAVMGTMNDLRWQRSGLIGRGRQAREFACLFQLRWEATRSMGALPKPLELDV
jgi:hypothetical protein